MLNVPEYLGFPLLYGDTLSATAASDLFFQWDPGKRVSFQRIHHPLPNIDIDTSPTARFGGYPPAYSVRGTVVGEDATHRFLAVISGHAEQAWHQDITNNLGIPLTTGKMIFSGFGGASATEGIFSVSADDGRLLWAYPAKPVPEDPQDVKTIVSPKSVVTMIPKAYPERVVAKDGKTYEAIRYDYTDLTPKTDLVGVSVPQPTSRQPWSHWRNPGIVKVGNFIIGEADAQIVALNQETGELIWSYPLEKDQVVRSLVATPDHIVLCVSTLRDLERKPVWEEDRKGTKHALLALTVKEGKQVWKESVPRAGNLIIADKRLYLMDGTLHAYASLESEGENAENDTEIGTKER